MDFLREGGWPMYPILASGLAGLILAVRHAAVPQRSLRPLIVGLLATAVTFGLAGTILGLIHCIRGLDDVVGEQRYVLFLIGLRESLNCAAAGLLCAALAAVPTAVGSWRMVRREEEIAATPLR